MNVWRRLYPYALMLLTGLALPTLVFAGAPGQEAIREVPPTLQEVPLYDERIPESLPMVDLTDPEGLNAFLAEVQRLQEDADAGRGGGHRASRLPAFLPGIASS
jgi:hypothetical protein